MIDKNECKSVKNKVCKLLKRGYSMERNWFNEELSFISYMKQDTLVGISKNISPLRLFVQSRTM